MARVFSFSVPDNESELIQILEKKIKEGSLSKEIVRVLKGFYFGKKGNNSISEEYLKLLEIEQKLNQALRLINEVQPEVEKLKTKFQEKQEEAKIEERLDLIRLLEHVVFEDMDYLRQRYGKEDLKYFIENRLTHFAAEHKISLPEAWDLFFKVFPGMKEELE